MEHFYSAFWCISGLHLTTKNRLQKLDVITLQNKLKKASKLITKKIKNGFDFSKFVEDACREKVNELIEILKRENSNSNIRESNNEAE